MTVGDRKRLRQRAASGLVAAVVLGTSPALFAPSASAQQTSGHPAESAAGLSAREASGTAAPADDDPAKRKKALDKQISDLRETLEGAKQDFVDAAVQLETSQANLVSARSDLAAAQAQLAAAQAKDALLADQLKVAQAEEQKAGRDLDAQTAAEATTRKQLGQIARSAYVGNQVSGLSIVLDSQSAEDLNERLAVAGAALRSQNEAIAQLAVQQAELRAQSARLAAVRAQVAELKRASAETVRQRQAAQAAAASAEAQITQLVATQKTAVAALAGKINDERSRLNALSAEQSKLRTILVARAKAARERAARSGKGGGGGGDSSSIIGSGTLSYPVSAPISSPFGQRFHPILRIWRLHSGQDFAAACGTPVHAAADGEIISAGWAGGYGNRIVIDNGELRGNGVATTYNHLSRIVRSGGSVAKGQLIGYSGTTGLSTGCHLHFEVLVNGNFVDPRNWF